MAFVKSTSTSVFKAKMLSSLVINEHTITEKPELLQAWKSHFSSLSKTKITDAVVDQTLQDEVIRMAHSSHNEDHVFLILILNSKKLTKLLCICQMGKPQAQMG